jgi:hypothetical protein
VNKLLVKAILEAAPAFKWQIQGLGMLRLYLSKAVRLHVWHSGFASPGVSTLHTHPWDFESTVVAGQLENIRYKETTGTANTELDTERFYSSLLHCGPGGGLKEDPQLVYLKQLPSEIYHEGESYTEKAEEIHESKPWDGTVTVVSRRFKPDEDHARVFWPVGTAWGSAIPRDATVEEVYVITQFALQRWFKQ